MLHSASVLGAQAPNVHLKPILTFQNNTCVMQQQFVVPHQVVCVCCPVAVCYCRHCDDIGPSVTLPFMRKRKKMIAYPSMPLKARCLCIVYPSQSTPDHLY